MIIKYMYLGKCVKFKLLNNFLDLWEQNVYEHSLEID